MYYDSISNILIGDPRDSGWISDGFYQHLHVIVRKILWTLDRSTRIPVHSDKNSHGFWQDFIWILMNFLQILIGFPINSKRIPQILTGCPTQSDRISYGVHQGFPCMMIAFPNCSAGVPMCFDRITLIGLLLIEFVGLASESLGNPVSIRWRSYRNTQEILSESPGNPVRRLR